jgi:hypothetical protein
MAPPSNFQHQMGHRRHKISTNLPENNNSQHRQDLIIFRPPFPRQFKNSAQNVVDHCVHGRPHELFMTGI